MAKHTKIPESDEEFMKLLDNAITPEKKEKFLKFLETYDYIIAAKALLDEFKTSNEIPDDRFHVRDFEPLKLKCFCIEVEERVKKAH